MVHELLPVSLAAGIALIGCTDQQRQSIGKTEQAQRFQAAVDPSAPPLIYASAGQVAPIMAPAGGDEYVAPDPAVIAERKQAAAEVATHLGVAVPTASHERAAIFMYEMVRRSDVFACGVSTQVDAPDAQGRGLVHFKTTRVVSRLQCGVPGSFVWSPNVAGVAPVPVGSAFCAFFGYHEGALYRSNRVARIAPSGLVRFYPFDLSPLQLENLAKGLYAGLPSVGC